MDVHYQTIRIDHHQLAYLALNPQATGQPIILLHGLASSIGFWQKGEPYTQYGPCYALSLPGHYPASFPRNFQSEELSAKELGRLVAEAIQQIAPDSPVTVLGYSTGALAGLAAAIHSPTLITRLICVAGFVNGQRTGSIGRLERLAQRGNVGWVLFNLAFGYRFHPALFRVATNGLVADRAALQQRVTLKTDLATTYAYARHLQVNAMWHYCQMLSQVDLAYRLPRVAAATLVITGDKDPIVPPEQSQLIASRVPHSHLVMISGAGHIPMWERPQQYQEAIHNWLTRT